MILQGAGLVLSSACFASFSWAVARLFAAPQGSQPAAMKWLGALGVAFFVLQLLSIAYLPSGSHRAVSIAGLCLFVVALSVFWWAVPYARSAKLRIAFADGQPDQLLTGGPYRYVRHPFYASYLMFWLAGVHVSQQWFLVSSVVVMGLFYVKAIRKEEGEFLSGDLAEPYRAYAANTGALLPRLFPFGLS